MTHWLIIYDIRDPKRLAKVAKILESIGVRVQYSVFESEAAEFVIRNVREVIRDIIEAEDFIIYFNLCQRDWEKRRHFAKGPLAEWDDSSYHIID